MPVIDARQILAELLRSCSTCYEEFCGNIATVVDENLTDEEVPKALAYMTRFHEKHVH